MIAVSSTLGGTPRRDSWDAIAKTKAMLSYGSLESLANLANSGTEHTNFVNEGYRNGYNNYSSTTNVERTVENSKNYTTRFTSDYRSSSPKYNGNHTMENGRSHTHGILKNRNNNYYKSTDTTDIIHERLINNEEFMNTTERRKGCLASGTALDVLPLHKPASFTLDPSVDGSKAVVTVTGNERLINRSILIR